VKINLVSLTMFVAGATFIYCGVKGFDPRDVVSWALGGKKPQTMADKKKAAETPKVDPKEHPGDKNYPPGTEDGGEPTTPAVFI
jgi:hypothetical protein